MESATGLNRNCPVSRIDEKHLPSIEQWEPKQGSELNQKQIEGDRTENPTGVSQIIGRGFKN
jgi:hypothetical protein